MLFNSLEFFIFLPTVYILYWFVFNKNLKVQNLFVLASSYVFYGWWDWRFLILILISSLLDFYIGKGLEKTEDKAKRNRLKYLSLIVNLGFLGVFKYFNFFIDSFADVIRMLGFTPHLPSLNILLPVGISFYTFQTIGYTLDIYKKKYTSEKDIVNFMVYVCFFPQLVAGPIERARNLLPQIRNKREFSDADARDGLRLILLGLFKKVVIADNLAGSVDYIFSNYSELGFFSLLLGGAFFIVQIYCDFAGYSEIAIGTARLFGFNLMKNFDFPYYVSNAQDFWNRWHISLSNWFRDYLLFSLKSSYKNRTRFALNFLFTLVIIGFWHGANWTFIVFGLINGLYIMPYIIWRKKINKVAISRTRTFPTGKELYHMLKMFLMLILPGVFFRSKNVQEAFYYFKTMFSKGGIENFQIPDIVSQDLVWLFVPLVLEWFMRDKEHALDIAGFKKPLRWAIYLVLLLVLLNYGEFQQKQFIYFQF